PQEALIRKAVMQAIKANGYDMIKSRQIETTASSIGASLDSNDGYRALAKELSLSAFVTGEVGRKKATLTVRNGADGTVNAEETWSGPNPRKLAADVARTFWRRLGSAVERGKPPTGAKKASKVPVVAEAPEDAEDAPDGASSDAPSKSDDKVAEADSPPKSRRRAAASADASASATEGSVEKSAESESEPVSNDAPRALDAWIAPRGFFRTLTFNQRARDTTVSDYLPRFLGSVNLLL